MISNKQMRLDWLWSVCVVTGLMASVFYLVPEPVLSPSARTLTMSKVRYLAKMASHDSSVTDELNAVWSPALIALPNGIIRQPFENERVDKSMPALARFNDSVMFLERINHQNGSRNINAFDGMSARLPPLLSSATPALYNTGLVGVSKTIYGEVSKGSIDWPELGFAEFETPGSPWLLTLRVSFNEEGAPVNVIIETPSVKKAVNERAVRAAYQSRLTGIAGPMEKRVMFSFPGNQVSTNN